MSSSERPVDQPSKSEPPPKRARSPLWKSKMLIIFTAFTLVGVVLWAIAVATAPPRTAASAAPGTSGLVSSHSDADSPARATEAPKRRIIDRASPALVRFGGSFMGGFFIGWAFRRFLKWSLLITGAVALGVVALRKSGLIDLPWDTVESGVEQSVEWAKHQSGAAKDIVMGYLPSGFAAVLGMFFGAQRG